VFGVNLVLGQARRGGLIVKKERRRRRRRLKIKVFKTINRRHINSRSVFEPMYIFDYKLGTLSMGSSLVWDVTQRRW
jgi:hypothetical protein